VAQHSARCALDSQTAARLARVLATALGSIIMKLVTELLRLEPTAELTTLSGLEVYRYQTVVPAFTFEVAVHFTVAGNGLVVKAKSGWRDEIVEDILAHALSIPNAAFMSNGMTVVPCRLRSSAPFEQLVFLPPHVARCYVHQSDTLQRKCAWVFPAYTGEFSTGLSLEDFLHQINRRDGWRIDVAKWDRRRKTEPSWEMS
jgi:hypothetical protein